MPPLCRESFVGNFVESNRESSREGAASPRPFTLFCDTTGLCRKRFSPTCTEPPRPPPRHKLTVQRSDLNRQDAKNAKRCNREWTPINAKMAGVAAVMECGALQLWACSPTLRLSLELRPHAAPYQPDARYFSYTAYSITPRGALRAQAV